MNSSDSFDHQEIKRLYDRLDTLSERHSEDLKSLRASIAKLESKLSNEPKSSAPENIVVPTEVEIPKTTPPPVPFQSEKVTTAYVPPILQADPIPKEAAPDSSFELNFGKVWFVRIGVVILLTGLVFLGNYAYQNWVREMPNGVRLVALFGCALALIETGRRLAMKESLSRFGEVLFGGGMAFFYYCTFAAHHVGRLKVIDSPVVAALLLFLAAGSMAAVSWLRQAKITAAFGFVLAAYATMLQPIGYMSCVSNILLGAAGLFFMLKPGWSGPGWASMLGSYGAFFGWQLLGAYGQKIYAQDPAILWFLPPLWVMFAVPGMFDRFRESLSDRARAWFTGMNNTLFFVLFSGIWINQNTAVVYWKVAAIFGPLLLLMGILGRRQNTIAGSVNISQGIAIATFALILKLEGHHLALTLAFECLALAMASWKFRGRSEVVFALLTGAGSAYLIFKNATTVTQLLQIAVWSVSLVALLLAAASAVTSRLKTDDEDFKPVFRLTSVFLFIISVMITSHLCLNRLSENAALITSISLSALLTIGVLKFDKDRHQPEIGWASLWILAIAGWLSFQNESIFPLAYAIVISFAACWLWHRETKKDSEPLELLTNQPACLQSILVWAFTIIVPLLLWQIPLSMILDDKGVFLFREMAAVALVPLAIALRCKRLCVTAAVFGLYSLSSILYPGVSDAWRIFTVVPFGIGAAFLLNMPWAKSRISESFSFLSSHIFRLIAFIAYCTAWYQICPQAWADWVSVTAIALTLGCLFVKRNLLWEIFGFVSVTLLWLLVSTVTSSWSIAPSESSWRGIGVILALAVLAFVFHKRNQVAGRKIIGKLAGLSCLVIAIWSTQMLVWRFGWKPTAVLWALLGFSYVSAGLWQRIHVLRLSGFILLAVSFIKLFAADVWDFTAFMRVVSFIVLGASLIVLGLFYNKFAITIKALLDAEKQGVGDEQKRE